MPWIMTCLKKKRSHNFTTIVLNLTHFYRVRRRLSCRAAILSPCNIATIHTAIGWTVNEKANRPPLQFARGKLSNWSACLLCSVPTWHASNTWGKNNYPSFPLPMHLDANESNFPPANNTEECKYGADFIIIFCCDQNCGMVCL